MRNNYKNAKRIVTRSMFLFLAIIVFVVIVPVGAVSAKDSSTPVYDQLVSGKKIMQSRSYDKPEKPTVYLTFDDGPSDLTPEVLDILKREGIRATFFVCGNQVAIRKDILKRIVDEGHAIGNHTYNHEYKDLYSDFDHFWGQIQKTEKIIQEVAGVRTPLLRAPGGTATNFDAFYFYYLDQAGYTIYDWNIDSGDSRKLNVPTKEIISTVEGSPLRHELTVLMHDGTGHKTSVEALPTIIHYFKNKGYSFAPITTKTNPEQFAVKKLKWTRSVKDASFTKQLGVMQKYAVDHNPNPKPVAVKEKEPAVETRPSLELDIGKQQLIMPPVQYMLSGNNNLKVPLRTIVESMGGTIKWDEVKQKVVIHYGALNVDYDTVHHKATIYYMGKQLKSYAWMDIEWRDGSIYVPWQVIVEQLRQKGVFSSGEKMLKLTVTPAIHAELLKI
ncbi:polysaccharide deacetylase [Paenibacillus sp. N1-5-1-14]|uniref:polysaccharide deacetylase n=1 Tax=Paenibacillus radicibacter TaxID=2972488 RepID=UPI002158D5F6|nr:polysaccharide deacetylase [Paenibacillus radicibacter]MCR8643033.1 polysaccharide deacetylase [Paenibacillus radicibacter]